MTTRPRTIRRTLVAIVATAVAAGALAAPPAEAVTNCTPSPSWGAGRADLASQVVSLVNAHRAAKGLSQLAISTPLTASSEWKSLHMASSGTFSHDDPAPPVARSAYQRATDCGYSGTSWGENIAYGYPTAQAVVDGWLASSGHRANIENARFTSTGVGVAASVGGRLYWTQNFGTDVGAGAPPPAPLPVPSPAPTPAPTAPPSTAPVPGSTAAGPSAPAPQATPASTNPGAPGAPPQRLAVAAKPARVTRQKGRDRLFASVSFVQAATGRPFVSGSVRCRAEVDGKRLRVIANTFDGPDARCAWRIPAWARGKQLRGVVAVQMGTSAAIRPFARTIE